MRRLIIDVVEYLPIDQEAANLMLQLVFSRYEHALIVLTSNLPSSQRGPGASLLP